jgi:hypothetical protein
MVDVDTVLDACSPIAAVAASVSTLSGLCDTVAGMSALSFAVESREARQALRHGGRVELVPPRQLDVDDAPAADDDDGLVPQPRREQPLTVWSVLTAVLYDMRRETGEEWTRCSGGYLPPLAWSGISPPCVPHLDIEKPSAPVVDRKLHGTPWRVCVCHTVYMVCVVAWCVLVTARSFIGACHTQLLARLAEWLLLGS